jgi:homocysteine S-methyltransferase
MVRRVATSRIGLAERLARGDFVLDGGLATELERRGHDLADRLWSARVLRDAPDEIEAVHRAYFDAGADVAITASYQATYEGFARAGVGRDETTRLLRLSVELARRARDAAHPHGLVAASVGPYGVLFADGTEYTGDYRGVADDEFAVLHRPRIEALLTAAPDVLAFETIPSLREVAALLELLGEFAGVEAWITFCCRDGGRLSDGTPVDDAARVVAGSGRVVALGINCTAPEHIDSLLSRMRGVTDLPLIVYPNSGRIWDGSRRVWRGHGGEGFADAAVAGWRSRGACGVGGCCGIGPDGIAGVARVLRTR